MMHVQGVCGKRCVAAAIHEAEGTAGRGRAAAEESSCKGTESCRGKLQTLLLLLQPLDSILKGIISARIHGRVPNPVDTASSLHSNPGCMRAFTFRARSSLDVQ